MEESDSPLVPQGHQGIVKEEVSQEGVSSPQPTQDQETQTALQELIQELTELPPHHVRGLGVPSSHLPLGASRVPERLVLRQMPHVPVFAILR